MKLFSKNVYYVTRSRRVLWQVAAVVIALGFAFGSLFFYVFGTGDSANEAILAQMQNVLQEENTFPNTERSESMGFLKSADLVKIIESLYRVAPLKKYWDPILLEQSLQINQHLEPIEKTIAFAALRSLDNKQIDPELTALASREPPPPYAHYALGYSLLYIDKKAQAADAFLTEGNFPDADYARSRAFHLLIALEAWAVLASLEENPLYAKFMDPQMKLDIAVNNGDWGRVVFYLIPAEYSRLSWAIILMALISGSIWFCFLIRAGQLAGVFNLTFLLCCIALLLGMLSAHLTLFIIYIQENVFGLVGRGEDLIGGLLYCIAGIGLREELAKLLLFIPLAPFFWKRGSNLEILTVAGCVGLGFAVQENMNYFMASQGIGAPGRFLTANFLHISLTALAGYGFCQIFRNWPNGINECASMFGFVVLVHGIYDAFLIVPELGEFALFAMTTFILMSYQFFRYLRSFRSDAQETISLTFTFVLGLSLIISMTLVYTVATVGPFYGTRLIVPELLSLAVIVIMFVREIPDALGE